MSSQKLGLAVLNALGKRHGDDPESALETQISAFKSDSALAVWYPRPGAACEHVIW